MKRCALVLGWTILWASVSACESSEGIGPDDSGPSDDAQSDSAFTDEAGLRDVATSVDTTDVALAPDAEGRDAGGPGDGLDAHTDALPPDVGVPQSPDALIAALWGPPVANEQGCDLWSTVPFATDYLPPVAVGAETWIAAKNGTVVLRLRSGTWSVQRGTGFIGSAAGILQFAGGNDWVAILVQKDAGNSATNRILWRSLNDDAWTDITPASIVLATESRFVGSGSDLVVFPMDGTIQAFSGQQWRSIGTTSWESPPSAVAFANSDFYYVRLGRLYRSNGTTATEVIATIDRLPPGSGSDPVTWQHLAYTGDAIYASANGKFVYKIESGVPSQAPTPGCSITSLLAGGGSLYVDCGGLHQFRDNQWIPRPGSAQYKNSTVAPNGDVVKIQSDGSGARMSAETGDWTALPIAQGPRDGRILVEGAGTIVYAFRKSDLTPAYARLGPDQIWRVESRFEGREIQAGLEGNLVDQKMQVDSRDSPTGEKFFLWQNESWVGHSVSGKYNLNAWPYRNNTGAFLFGAVPSGEYKSLDLFEVGKGFNEAISLDCFQHRRFGYFGAAGIVTSGCVGVRTGRRTYGRVEEFDGVAWTGRDSAEQPTPKDLYQMGPPQSPQVWLRRDATSPQGGSIFDVRSGAGWSVRTLPPPAGVQPIYLSPPDPVVAVINDNAIGISRNGGSWQEISPWFLRTQPIIVNGFEYYNAWTDGRWFWATTSSLSGSVLRCDLASK